MKHYTVKADETGYKFGLAKFTNMTEFVGHFESQPLLGGESGILWTSYVHIFFKFLLFLFFLSVL